MVVLEPVAPESRSVVASPDRACGDPHRVIASGEDTGIVRCQGGWFHRVAREPSVVLIPSDSTCPQDVTMDDLKPSCSADSECREGRYGRCVLSHGPFGGSPCQCEYTGCASDAECRPREVCLPAGARRGDNFVGVCVPANCATDADCGEGSLCASLGWTFACQQPDDQCDSDRDCVEKSTAEMYLGDMCVVRVDEPRACEDRPESGRPFLVRGVEETAGVVERSDWSSSEFPPTAGMDPELRKRVAALWTRNALMEHASIAAFARFALHLLSLGAPATLVEATCAATADETRHARTAFAFASAYAGVDVGPSRLNIDNALDDLDALSIIRLAFREGCVGETVAAITAAEGAAHATHTVVADVLARIADDETSHAELAWRFVAWACECVEGAADLVREEAAIAEATIRVAEETKREEAEDALLDHGLIGATQRAEIHRSVVREVVMPCAALLVARCCGDDSSRRIRDGVLSEPVG
jgi:hypothetical protein